MTVDSLEPLRDLHARLAAEYSRVLARYAKTAHPDEDVSKAGVLLYGAEVDVYIALLAEAAAERGISTPLGCALTRSKGADVAELRRVASLVGLPSWPLPDSA